MVLAGDDDCLLDPLQTAMAVWISPSSDAVAADLDLFIGATQILRAARWHASAPGPRCDTSAFRARRKDRARTAKRSAGPAHIPHPHTAPGHIQLADHPGSDRPQPPVQHEQRRPGNR